MKKIITIVALLMLVTFSSFAEESLFSAVEGKELTLSEMAKVEGGLVDIFFYVTSITGNSKGGNTARGRLVVRNNTTGERFTVYNVVSGGIKNLVKEANSQHAPFGTYDILQKTGNKSPLYHRLEAKDKNYGDDIVEFYGTHKLIRIHGKGSTGTTSGCIAIFKSADEKKILRTLNNTSTEKVFVKRKVSLGRLAAEAALIALGQMPPHRPKTEKQTKYGTLKILKDF